MKNQILFGLIIILFNSCKTEVESNEEVKSIEKEVNIKIDERIELLSIVQHFTTWAEYAHNRYDLTYKSEVEEYFKPYSNHKAVKL